MVTFIDVECIQFHIHRLAGVTLGGVKINRRIVVVVIVVVVVVVENSSSNDRATCWLLIWQHKGIFRPDAPTSNRRHLYCIKFFMQWGRCECCDWLICCRNQGCCAPLIHLPDSLKMLPRRTGFICEATSKWSLLFYTALLVLAI